jgi:RHS repeat-associated protein
VYKDNWLAYILTPEGRIVIPQPTGDGASGKASYYYEYQLKDHLGNVRVTFTDKDKNGVPEVQSENHYYPFGMPIAALSYTNNVTTHNTIDYKNEYFYNGKEAEDDFGLGWLDFGWRDYDPVIGRWWSPDKNSETYISWSPYHYGADNPIKMVELNGMDYYYTEDGKYLGQDNKNTQFVYSVRNDSWSGVAGNYLVIDSGMDQIMDNQGNAMLHDQFKDLAGTLYAEAGTNGSWKESAGIYSALENRANADNKTTLDEAKAPDQAYGYNDRKKIDSPLASKDQVQNAYKGLIRGALDSKDYSGGGYFWQGTDFSEKGSRANKSYYQAGFHFNDNSHDLWNQGEHKSGNNNWDYKYESTGASGKTIFMKLTQEWQNANTSNYWNGSYKK